MSVPRSLIHTGRMTAAVLAILLALGSRPASASSPKATITPATGLVDGQVATVRASGFPPHRQIQVLECEGTVAQPPRSNRSCDGITFDGSGYSDAHGDYLNAPTSDPTSRSSGYVLFTLPSRRVHSAGNIHCGPSSPCVIYVGLAETDFTQPHTFVALSFKGAPAKHSSSRGAWILITVLVVAVVLFGAFWVRARRRSGPPPASRPRPATRAH